MSEILKSKMKEQTLPEIEKISNSANELLNKMNTIIWTMTSSNDSVENLVAYIVHMRWNSSKHQIDCYFNMPGSIPPRESAGRKEGISSFREEALNNVLNIPKDDGEINVLVNERLIIEILDDGVGSIWRSCGNSAMG